MATLTRPESKKLYSWWWDGHTAPKNSKWLKENLQDMDIKVKAMIKLLEEDADSFAKRAEMYYKKRPELLKLLEEFYRAYRAIAERYDHATGALRQAHRTMAEVFPHQVPFVLPDESPYGEMSSTPHTLFDSNDSQKNTLHLSSPRHGIKRNGGYSDEGAAFFGHKGLKKLNEILGSGEEATHAMPVEGRKILEFPDDEENSSESRDLQEEISQLSNERQDLKSQITSESVRADKSEAEVQSLKDIISKSYSKMEAFASQQQLSLEKISTLEAEISRSKEDLKTLNDEMSMAVAKLNTGEDRCLVLEKANDTLQMELVILKQKAEEQQEELHKKQEELVKLKLLLQEKHQVYMQAETACLSLEKLLSQSQEKERLLDLEIQVGNEKMKDIELRKAALEEKLRKIMEDNGSIYDQNLASASKIRDLQVEVQSLNEILSKLNTEKETATLQLQLSLERISALETEISHTEGDLKKLKDEALITVAKLNSSEEQCLLVAKANESLHMELDRLKQEVLEKQEALSKKQEELEKLNQGFVQATTARLSLEKLLFQSQEQERLLGLEIQAGIEKLKDSNLRRVVLEEELRKIKEEHGSLNEQCLTSASTIIILQDEISSFNVSNMKLENEASLLRDEKKALQEEFSSLKDDRNELKQSYHQLTEQVEAANFNVKSLQALVKQLQSGNAELKERCNRHENEKNSHLENLKDMVIVSEKNVVLENSLSDANVEIETLREKVKGLEQSCELLCDEISLHLTDKATMVSQLKTISQEMENLLERNAFLKNSLSDANVELEDLRGKLKVSEESCQSLSTQNSNLISEKSTLVSQVEETSQALENLEVRFVELEDKHFSLESEKDFALQQVTELRDLLKRDKEEYETLILSIMLSSNSQISTLENQMDLMQEEGRLSEEEFEEEQVQSMSADIEMIVLQESVREMHEKNSILSLQSQKLLEKSKSSDKLISQLTKELLIQEKNLNHRSFNVMNDGVALQILSEIKNLRISFSDSQDENQLLRLENSVVMTILEQFGLDMTDLAKDKFTLEQESKTKNEEILMRQSNEIEQLQVIKQLSQDLHANNQKHVLKSDKDIHGVVNDLNKEIVLLTEIVGAIEVENVCLKETVSDLYKRRHMMTSEIDLNTSRTSYEKMSLEIESEKIPVTRHDGALLQANEKEDKNTDSPQNLEGLQPDIEVFSLSEDDVQIAHETSCACQANEILTWELNRLHKEVEDLRSREEQLSFELQIEVNEVNCCEVEIAKLFEDIQITTVSAVLFEEKVFELLVECESLEISSMVERERFYEEITASNANVVELNEKFGIMEGENRGMKEALNSYLLLVEDLSDDISSLEEGILSLAERYLSKNQEKQGSELASHRHHQSKSTQDPAEYQTAAVPAGILELQKLDAKVKALKKVVIGTGNLLKQETSEATGTSPESALQEVRLVKAKGHLDHEEKISKGGDAGPSRMKDEQKMKDIPLDLVLSSSQRGNDVRYFGGSTIDIAGRSDISLDSWEIPERVEAAEGRSRYPSSERVFEKELSIDKLELPQKFTEPHQEWNGRVTEALSSDAQRLSVIQKSARELRRNMEASDMCNYPTTFEFDTIKAQLKEAEGAISQLIDINGKLTKKAEHIATLTGLVQEPTETQSKHRRQISELAGRSSEKIGRLELELQKIQYIFLKLREEHDNKKPRGMPGRRVLLRDYIYGRMDSRRRRKGRCGCIRPKTSDD